MGMKLWKKGSVKIRLPNFVLLIFHWKMLNDLAVELAVEVDETYIKAIIDSDRHSTTREIAEKLNVSHTCTKKKKKIKTAWLFIYFVPYRTPWMVKFSMTLMI